MYGKASGGSQLQRRNNRSLVKRPFPCPSPGYSHIHPPTPIHLADVFLRVVLPQLGILVVKAQQRKDDAGGQTKGGKQKGKKIWAARKP